MSEARWKLVVDEDGVTIAGDRYQLRTAPTPFAVDEAVFGVTESPEMEAIVSELEAMTRRTYGQYCGLARAMEVIGERWAPLIVRDLLVSDKTFDDLLRGLPRMPDEVLSSRLRELQHTGVISSRELPASDGAATDGTVIYSVTDFGRELEDVVVLLGRWGVRLLGEPRPEDIFTPDLVITSLRATFRPERTNGERIGFELHIFDMIVHARVDGTTLHTGTGSLPDADLVLESGFALKPLLSGELTAAAALAAGSVRLAGDPALFSRFTELFQLPRPAAAQAA
ncbi:MAG: winged helix-turn-helix transcriptional regulator [Labedaea sp.]